MYARMKAQLVMLGRLPRAVSRPPILPVAADEEGSLREALVRAGLIEAAAAPHAS
jgi:4-hydroxy-tetrahydrodipicolinate synthase